MREKGQKRRRRRRSDMSQYLKFLFKTPFNDLIEVHMMQKSVKRPASLCLDFRHSVLVGWLVRGGMVYFLFILQTSTNAQKTIWPVRIQRSSGQFVQSWSQILFIHMLGAPLWLLRLFWKREDSDNNWAFSFSQKL